MAPPSLAAARALAATLVALAPLSTSAAYLGLRNQGNTCYMNSLLQTLHHLPEFRQAIYSIPTQLDNTSAVELVPLELQRVFYELQYAEATGASEVGTELLTRSFGWGRREVMVQQDVQEFARMLCDALQSSMHALAVPDGIASLFEGRTSSLTRCTRVKFESEKEERFYDLQVQVQGCSSLHAALRAFVREERLQGDNKYNTRNPDLGRQDARRAVRFKHLPPVLQMHLKRFEYDYESGTMRKLQQEFAFPTKLRLHRYMARGADPPSEYVLQAVLSHAGDAGSGHYVAYVRPRGEQTWYEFDDTRVTPVREEVAVRQQYGGRYARGRAVFGAPPNAYMLVYVRKDLESSPVEGSDGSALPPAVMRAFEQQLKRSGGRGGGASSRRKAASAPPLASDVVDSLFD